MSLMVQRAALPNVSQHLRKQAYAAPRIIARAADVNKAGLLLKACMQATHTSVLQHKTSCMLLISSSRH